MTQPATRSLPLGYSVESDPDVVATHAPTAEAIARAGGIRLMRGRELTAVILHEDGLAVAGLWTEGNNHAYTFDVAVDAAHQRRGLGRRLAIMGQDLGREWTEVGSALELTAVSPGGEALARHLGMVETSRSPSGSAVFKPLAVALNEAAEALIEKLPRVEEGEPCGGFKVRHGIDNTSSIGATLGDDYASHGVREVPMGLLGPDPDPSVRARLARDHRIAKLAASIKESGELTPLIVVVNGLGRHQDGPAYVLEGSHRIDALEILEAKSFPALVIQDLSPATEVRDGSDRIIPIAERFAWPLIPRVESPETSLLRGALTLPPPAEPAPAAPGVAAGLEV